MCRRLITEFVGFCLHFYLDQKCALETNLPVATIFCPVVHITGQLRGEQSDISEPEGNEKITAGGATQGIPSSTSVHGTPLELA